MKSRHDFLKANNSEYFNCYTPREHNVPLFSLSLGTLNKGLLTSPETIKLPINTKRLVGLKITSVKLAYPNGKTGRFSLSRIVLSRLDPKLFITIYYYNNS